MIYDPLSLTLFVLGGLSIAIALFDFLVERHQRSVQMSLLNPSHLGHSIATQANLTADQTPFEHFKQQVDVAIRSISKDLNANFTLARELEFLRGAIALSLFVFLGVSITIYILFHLIGSALALGGFAAFGAFQIYSHIRIQRHADAITNALPQAVDGLIRCLKAGFDLSRSFTIVSSEVAPELQREFRLLIRNRDLGQSLGDAMFRLADRLRNPETLFLATLIAIQERSGGPLIDALTSLSQILRDRERLRQKRIVASAEARMSALILGGLPVLVSVMLFASNPSYRETLLNSQSGRGFLLLAGLLLVSGSLVMYRMIRVDPK